MRHRELTKVAVSLLAPTLLFGCDRSEDDLAGPAVSSPTATVEIIPTEAPSPEPTSTTAPTTTPTTTPRPTDTPIPPTETATMVPPTPTLEPTEFPAVGTDITISLPEGNVDDGLFLARRWGCYECHITFTHGPLFLSSAIGPSISERAASRIEDPSYTGTATTAEEYLVESILLPEVYVVEFYEREPMDDDYDERLTAQDVADILAWLSTLE
jgi:hypothetical protein